MSQNLKDEVRYWKDVAERRHEINKEIHSKISELEQENESLRKQKNYMLKKVYELLTNKTNK